MIVKWTGNYLTIGDRGRQVLLSREQADGLFLFLSHNVQRASGGADYDNCLRWARDLAGCKPKFSHEGDRVAGEIGTEGER